MFRELRDQRLEYGSVIDPCKAVTPVGGEQQPRVATTAPDRGDEPRRVTGRHTRIVGALRDEQRPVECVGTWERRDPGEKRTDRRIALVAVFGPSLVAAVCARALEKR